MLPLGSFFGLLSRRKLIATCKDYRPTPHSSAQAAVVHIIGNFFAFERQFEVLLYVKYHLILLSQVILLLYCQFEVSGSLFPQIVRVFVHRCPSFSVSSPPIIGETGPFSLFVWTDLYTHSYCGMAGPVSRRQARESNMVVCEDFFDSGLCVMALHTKFLVL